MPAKKKQGMMGKAIRSLNKTNVATGVKPIRVTRKKKKAKPTKKVVNRNKSTIKITTSAAKAKAQKAAIRKRVAARVAKAKKK